MKLNTGSNNREIATEYLKIHGNCMEFKDTILQLSNISLISTTNIDPEKFPLWSLALVFFGLLMILFTQGGLVLLGLFLACCGGAVIYFWYTQTQKTKMLKRLTIVTNSGNFFSIVFNNQAFLDKVVHVLNEIISNPGHLSDVSISIKDNTFTGGSSAIHDYTELHI